MACLPCSCQGALLAWNDGAGGAATKIRKWEGGLPIAPQHLAFHSQVYQPGLAGLLPGSLTALHPPTRFTHSCLPG